MNRGRVYGFGIIILLMLVFAGSAVVPVWATEFRISAEQPADEDNSFITDIQEEFNFAEIQEFLEDNYSGQEFEFSDMVRELMAGKSDNVFKRYFKLLKESVLKELDYNRDVLKKIIIISIFAAVFTNFSMILGNRHISETGFHVSYLLIVTLLLTSFGVLSGIAVTVLERLVDFMKALLPVYMVSLGVNIGQAGASSYYGMALMIITVIEFLCLKVLIPAAGIYMILTLVNNISKEDFISKASQLIKKAVNFSIKSMFTIVTSMNVIQGMLLPVTGTVRNNAAKSVLGIMSGGISNNITNLVYGSASLVKSGIGTAGMIVVCVIMIVPIVKMLLFIFGYNIINVILQPVTDKRIINSIEGVTEGAELLLRCVFLCSMMFIVTIAIICVTTN